MYLAPAADAIVEDCRPGTVLKGWPPADTITTQLAVQYGRQDTLVGAEQVAGFIRQLDKAFPQVNICVTE